MGPLAKRFWVALIGIPLLLLATFWEISIPFKVIVLAGLGLGLGEFFRLVEARKLKVLRAEGFLVLGCLLLPWMGSASLRPYAAEGFLLGLLILTLSFLWSKRPLRAMVVSVSVTFWGAAYFGILGQYFLRLRDLPHGAWHLSWLFIATWAYDTGGYFAGKWWGKRHFAPLASPKKTVEGCVGGVLLTLIGLLIFWKAFDFYAGFYSLGDILVLALSLSLFGQLGDLVESLIKRSLTAKDSGSILPGHGGIFDRIDSLLFNAPVLFYYLTILK